MEPAYRHAVMEQFKGYLCNFPFFLCTSKLNQGDFCFYPDELHFFLWQPSSCVPSYSAMPGEKLIVLTKNYTKPHTYMFFWRIGISQ